MQRLLFAYKLQRNASTPALTEKTQLSSAYLLHSMPNRDPESYNISSENHTETNAKYFLG